MKKKVKKTVPTVKVKKSPTNYRIFTDWKTWVLILSIAMFLATILSIVTLWQAFDEKQKIDQQREKIVKEIDFWQETAQKYPDYRDAYYQMAVLEYKLGDKEKSREFLQKALDLDPNFDAGWELKKRLE